MRTEHSQADKASRDIEAHVPKRPDAAHPRVRMIRLDRHIRQAEWVELLRGRS